MKLATPYWEFSEIYRLQEMEEKAEDRTTCAFIMKNALFKLQEHYVNEDKMIDITIHSAKDFQDCKLYTIKHFTSVVFSRPP